MVERAIAIYQNFVKGPISYTERTDEATTRQIVFSLWFSVMNISVLNDRVQNFEI